MPNIREIDIGRQGLQPTEIGVDARLQAARRGGAFFNQAAEDKSGTGQRLGSAIRDAGDAAVKFQEHREISAGAANFAALQEAKTKEWNATAKAADPNDPSVAGQFREENLNPALDDFRKSFITEGGQRWAETHVDRAREHFFQKTSADMASLAADAVHTNVLKTVNSLGSTTYNDPSSLKFSLDTLKGSVDGMADSSPNLTPTAAAKVKNDLMMTGTMHIVKSAVMGAIVKGGDWQKIANDPAYTPYINQAEITQFATADRRLRHAEAADQRTAELMERRQNQENAMDRSSEYLTKFINPETGEYTFPKNFRAQVLTDPVLTKYPSARRDLLSQYDAIQSGRGEIKKTQISQQTARQLIADVRSGRITGDGPLYEAYDQDKLTKADFDFVKKEYDERRTPAGEMLSKDRGEFFKRYAASVDGAMDLGGHSALGSQRLYAFEKDARRLEEDLRRQGLDPHLAYDPRSPHFLGRPENLSKYHVSMTEAMNYEKSLTGTAPAHGAPAKTPGMPDNAQKAPDGNYYIPDPDRPGKFLRVNVSK